VYAVRRRRLLAEVLPVPPEAAFGAPFPVPVAAKLATSVPLGEKPGGAGVGIRGEEVSSGWGYIPATHVEKQRNCKIGFCICLYSLHSFIFYMMSGWMSGWMDE
jgi:hypothetical protein